MSFQFQDESALEELLNQQLDRRKQRPATGLISQTSSVRPNSSTIPQTNPLATTNSRLAQPAEDQRFSERLTRPTTAQLARSVALEFNQHQLSSLPADSSQPVRGGSTQRSLTAVSQQDQFRLTNPLAKTQKQQNQRPLSSVDIEAQLNEETLQELSKQRLIRLILGDIKTALEESKRQQAASGNTTSELERIKEELNTEREVRAELERRQAEVVEKSQANFQKLQRQLETRLERSQKELDELKQNHKQEIAQLQQEHQLELEKLSASYQERLAEERRQFEDATRKREQLHQLELDSKLKVNCELTRLDSVFGDWHQMIESTIRELNAQYKSVEGLLGRQSVEINSRNAHLADKSQRLEERYVQFEERGKHLEELAKQMDLVVPKLVKLQEENEKSSRCLADQLMNFLERDEQLRKRELDLRREHETLAKERAQVSEEKYQLGLESNRVTFREERAAELSNSNRELELRLTEQQREQATRSSQLESLRLSLEAKGAELRDENYRLHIARKELSIREEELARQLDKLLNDQRRVEMQISQIKREARNLRDLRARTSREVSQMRRLEKSLVCSLCLDRLFPRDQSNQIFLETSGKFSDDPEVEAPLGSPRDRDQREAHLTGDRELDAERELVELLACR